MWLLFLLAVFTIDQISKCVAVRAGLVVLNQGISFSWLAASSDQGLTVILIILSLVLLYVSIKSKLHNTRPVIIGLFFGAVFSNLVDRIIWGGVQDWIKVPFLGVTNNIADWLIVGSIFLFFVKRYENNRSF